MLFKLNSYSSVVIFCIFIVLCPSLYYSRPQRCIIEERSQKTSSSIQEYETIDGFQAAILFKQCKPRLAEIPHHIDIVTSPKYNLTYIDNVKAASESIQLTLYQSLGMTWCTFDCWPHRTSSKTIPYHSHLKHNFRFSFVRDPVTKFESGVRQAWFQDKSLRSFTGDEIMSLQIQKYQDRNSFNGSFWINEHLMPNSWRLSPHQDKPDKSGFCRLVDLNFIGKVENKQDWNDLQEVLRKRGVKLGNLAQIHSSKEDTKKLGRNFEDSLLSNEYVKKMCESELYGQEWDCFSYKKPEVCE